MPNEPKTGEWQIEERVEEVEIPAPIIDETGIKGMTTFKDKRVIREKVAYAALTERPRCSANKHRFGFLNEGRRDTSGRLLVKCERCDQGHNFIPGMHRLENGRLLSRGRDF